MEFSFYFEFYLVWLPAKDFTFMIHWQILFILLLLDLSIHPDSFRSKHKDWSENK